MKHSISFVFSLLLLGLGVNACAPAPVPPTPTPIDVNAIGTAAMQTALAELTRIAPTYTSTPTITPTPVNTSTPTPTETPVALSADRNIAIYMIYTTDPENCSYYPHALLVDAMITGSMEENLRLAVSYLLATKWEESGALTNPLATSNLRYSGVSASGGVVNVTLGGTVVRHEDECLNRQASDQLKATIGVAVDRFEQYRGLDVVIWVDSFLFDDLMLSG